MVPSASDSGTLRVGLRTSPAVKVTLFQESAANSEPICAVHRATMIKNALSGERPSACGGTPAGVQAWPKLPCTTAAFQPRRQPITITPTKVPIFMLVNTFCVPLPYLSPRLLVQVTKATRNSDRICAVDSDTA